MKECFERFPYSISFIGTIKMISKNWNQCDHCDTLASSFEIYSESGESKVQLIGVVSDLSQEKTYYSQKKPASLRPADDF